MNSKFYVATAIIYVNDKPHIGNSLDYLTADVLARYHRQQGQEVVFSTGTDEHGGKIAEKAQEQGLEIQEFVDKNAANFEKVLQVLNISNNRLVRTTNKAHIERAKLIWQALDKFIYKDNFEGWYCVGCEEYKTDTHVEETEGVCPDHNRKYEKLVEQNYFFKLSEFSERIIEAIETKTLNILPEYRSHEILNVIKDGLQDISISRPKEKLAWGIEVPGDETQVMYVWFEALMNYITILGYPEHSDFADFWPADVQVIGKGILRFHAAIWPAMLLGLGLELPKVLYVHGYATSEGKKISKTLGNVVDPIEIAQKYGVDAYRYYFLRHIPSYNDGDYSNERFEAVFNGELANELGNAVSRVVGMVLKYQEGVIGEVRTGIHDADEYHQAIANCRFDQALEHVWQRIQELNKYIEVEKPWDLAKNDQEHLREVLVYACSSLLEIADLLVPFLPDTAKKITETFEKGVIKPLEQALFQRIDTPKQPTQNDTQTN